MEKDIESSDFIEPPKLAVLKQPEYKCPQHGNVGNLYLSFDFYDTPELNKLFCIHCYMEKLIELGVSQLEEIT